LILLDTSGLLAAYDSDEPLQQVALRALQNAAAPRLVSPFVLAELDYLVRQRVGDAAAMTLLEEVSRGAYKLAQVDEAHIAEARDLILRYHDLGIGLTDASIVVLARRYDVHDVLTLDERHFRVLRGPRDLPFRILPTDA
jgi:predicted nucleic acid-binding protein